MPPIRKLDEAFLAQLLDNENTRDGILNTNIDSKSLSTVLTKLTTTSDALQQELFQQVYTHFDEFSTSYNTSQELYGSILKLIQQVDTSEQQVKESQTIVTTSIEKYQQALLASEKNKVKIDTLETLEQMLDIINMIQLELKECLYLEAVEHIAKLETILSTWQADTRVMNLLNERMASMKLSLIHQLQDDIRASIQYNMGSMRILTTFKSTPTSTKSTHIGHVLQSLHRLGLLPEEMMGIQRLVFKNIFNPYFEQGNSHYLQIDHVTIDEFSSGGVLQVIKNTPQNEDEEDIQKMDPILMLQQLDNILGFFFKYFFENTKDDELNLVFGNVLLPQLEKTMITHGIAPAIPSTKYNLSDFNVIAQAVTSFENQCTSTYGYQVYSEDPSVLSLYVQNIDKHYAKKRRERILQDGRKVMVRKLYDAEMTQVNEDGHIYKYQITQTPQILSVLISDTLDEASHLLKEHPISATTLVEGIQDLLDMYRAIMPSYHRRQFLSGPASSLIFRNDCLWLAKQMTSVVAVKPESKSFHALAADLNEASNRLQELGKAWYEIAMMRRVQVIQSLLDQLDGFTGMAENIRFQQDCEQTITKVIQLVHSFAAETQPVVDETLFLDMLGRIVGSILGRLIRDIEELADIGADESHVIAVTLNSLTQLVSAFDLPGKDATESFVSELVDSWEKFWLVKDILEMNMREIMDAYRRGVLHMFEKSELVGLLCALFADTELREANIQEIKTGRLAQERSVAAPSQTVVHQPTATNAASALSSLVAAPTSTPSPVPSLTTSALEYTPDDDMEVAESGWGDDDDDDLFADEQLLQTIATPPTVSKSLEPSPLLEVDMMDMEDTEGGWGDADQDIFDEEPTNIPEEKKSIDTTVVAQPSKDKSTPVLSRALDFQAIDSEIDNELNDGWGWDDDDDDLFKEETK
ncbi:hypothetical protein INT48_004991 [Thamnidium elegans]|uniref:Retrograde transport protein Dsl1 C-terminal domain-containing protein n=1 Tax=Thamnidium elegans TaxID=101142 RepID=A0A8H7VXU3_9FUNG|nr:hypothetical protein INT48_004991 [Thamnidium elegans]